MKVLAALIKQSGMTYTAELLLHSCQDTPQKLSYSSSSGLSSSIKNSNEYRKEVNNIKSIIRKKANYTYNKSGGMELLSKNDLHYSLQHVDCYSTAIKRNRTCNFEMSVTDTYNFDFKSLKNSASSKAVVIINNYAALAQTYKAINPYKIEISINDQFIVY